MMRFLADENLDNRILRGLLRRNPDLDVVRVQDLDISGANDDDVLAWATGEQRVLLTHDQRTVPLYAYRRMERGESIAGVIVIPDSLAVGEAIDDLLLIIDVTSDTEWVNQVLRLPL